MKKGLWLLVLLGIVYLPLCSSQSDVIFVRRKLYENRLDEMGQRQNWFLRAAWSSYTVDKMREQWARLSIRDAGILDALCKELYSVYHKTSQDYRSLWDVSTALEYDLYFVPDRDKEKFFFEKIGARMGTQCARHLTACQILRNRFGVRAVQIAYGVAGEPSRGKGGKSVGKKPEIHLRLPLDPT